MGPGLPWVDPHAGQQAGGVPLVVQPPIHHHQPPQIVHQQIASPLKHPPQPVNVIPTAGMLSPQVTNPSNHPSPGIVLHHPQAPPQPTPSQVPPPHPANPTSSPVLLLTQPTQPASAFAANGGGGSGHSRLASNVLSGKDPLAYAMLLRSRGKLMDSLMLYESILAEQPRNVEALVGKGVCLQSQGLLRPAFEAYVVALSLDPKNAVALTQCGVLYKEEGHLLEAIEAYRKALEVDASCKDAAEQLAVVLTDLGTRLKLSGNIQEGISKYYEAISVDPNYAPAYYNLGVVFSEMAQYEAALGFYEKAATLRPLYAEAHCNMGVIYKNCGDLHSAISCYERCLAVAPNFTIAKNNMAIALTDLGTKVKLEGDIHQGVTHYEKALLFNSQYADAMYNLGVAYGEMLQFDKAIVMYELALHFNPQCAEACNNLGVIYKDRDNLEKAVECYQNALRIKPNFSQSLNNLGVVYTVQGKMDLALNMIQAAILANPSYAEAYNNLGVLHRDAGNIPAAIEAYEQCLHIDPDSRNAGQNRLLAMNYIYEGQDEKLFTAHSEWGKRFGRLFPQYTTWNNSRDADRPIVVGYISPDYFTHSVSYFIEAPLTFHNSSQFKVIVYSAVVKADGKTLRFKDMVLKKGGSWRDIFGMDEKKVAAAVREDGVDILIELTGHTANNRLGVMACRPAPIQATWIGYPNTTGLHTIDYRITDALADPPDTKQRHVEELVRLPGCFLCYTPSTEAGPVSPSPALANGFVTFGSFNNLAKITPRVVKLWARILRQVPTARLMVKCKPFSCTSINERFMAVLQSEGIDSLRVDLLPLILLNHDHMQAYSHMDISLDTLPYAGTTTTCESLYMGVPCVSMSGLVHANNVGVSLLNQIQLGHLVAHSEEEYIQLAVQLASDIPKLAALRASMRERMLSSPLCDGRTFTKGLEQTFRKLWHRYCREGGGVPSSPRSVSISQNGTRGARIEEIKQSVGEEREAGGNEGGGGGGGGGGGEHEGGGSAFGRESGGTRTAEGVSEAVPSTGSVEAPVMNDTSCGGGSSPGANGLGLGRQEESRDGDGNGGDEGQRSGRGRGGEELGEDGVPLSRGLSKATDREPAEDRDGGGDGEKIEASGACVLKKDAPKNDKFDERERGAAMDGGLCSPSPNSVLNKTDLIENSKA